MSNKRILSHKTLLIHRSKSRLTGDLLIITNEAGMEAFHKAVKAQLIKELGYEQPFEEGYPKDQD